jgi:anti-sigma B factor antagonist
MEITTNEYKHCALVSPKGRIDSSTSPKFKEAIDSLIDKGNYRLVVNLKDVEFLSSAGLRVFILAQKACKRYNRGEVVLVEVPKQILEVLDISGFKLIFKTFNSVIDGVAYF